MSAVPVLTLAVTVDRARNLPDERVGIFGTQDPYCTLSIERPGQTIASENFLKTQSIRHGNSNPKWGEAFQLRLPHARMNFLSLRILNDNVLLDTDIANTKIPLYMLLHGKPVQGWFPLYGNDDQSGGEVFLRLQVTGNIRAYLARLSKPERQQVTNSFAAEVAEVTNVIKSVMLDTAREYIEDAAINYLFGLMESFAGVDDEEFDDEAYANFGDDEGQYEDGEYYEGDNGDDSYENTASDDEDGQGYQQEEYQEEYQQEDYNQSYQYANEDGDEDYTRQEYYNNQDSDNEGSNNDVDEASDY